MCLCLCATSGEVQGKKEQTSEKGGPKYLLFITAAENLTTTPNGKDPRARITPPRLLYGPLVC